VKITKKALKNIIQEELQHLEEDETITAAEHSELKELRSRPELNENEDEVELGRPFEGVTLNKYQIALEEEISKLMVQVDLLTRRVTDLEDKIK
jgi:hypothetical protein